MRKKDSEFEIKNLKQNKPFIIATLIATILFVALIANGIPRSNFYSEMDEMHEYMHNEIDNFDSDFHEQMHNTMHGNEFEMHHFEQMDLNLKQEIFAQFESEFHEELLGKKMYKCCLENPCHTCISLSPYHGEGATCNCLEDLVNQKAPCGECVGGILAGRGNPYLAQYFAKSISEEFDGNYLMELKQIIEIKYGVPIDEQY